MFSTMSKSNLLQPLQGENFDNKAKTREEEAGLDIKANGLWAHRFSRCFFDVKIFNPLTKTSKTLLDPYNYHENLKKLKYQQRLLHVEQRRFVLLISCTGGAAPGETEVMQRLAKIGEKILESVADAMNCIRTKVSFPPLSSSVLCLRG